MGMVQSFYRATDAQISELLTAPDKAYLFDQLVVRDNAEGVYIDKTWHALHFLLTGKSYGGEPPLDFINYGAVNGRTIEGTGHDLVHAFFSDEVKNIAAALRDVTPKEFRRRFVPSRMAEMAMAEIYPEEFWSASSRHVTESHEGIVHLVYLETRPPLNESDYKYIEANFEERRDYLLTFFKLLKGFVLESSKQGMGIITYRH
jgi:hypothetical protein